MENQVREMVKLDMNLPIGAQLRAIDERITDYRSYVAHRLEIAKAEEAKAIAGRPSFAPAGQTTRWESGAAAVRRQVEELLSALDLEIARRRFVAAGRAFKAQAGTAPNATQYTALTGIDYTAWRAAAYAIRLVEQP